MGWRLDGKHKGRGGESWGLQIRDGAGLIDPGNGRCMQKGGSLKGIERWEQYNVRNGRACSSERKKNKEAFERKREDGGG